MSRDWQPKTKTREIQEYHRIQAQQDRAIMERIHWGRKRKITRFAIIVSGFLFVVSIIGSYGVLTDNVQLVEASKLVIFGVSAVLIVALYVWSVAVTFEEEVDQIREHGFIYAYFLPNFRAIPYLIPLVLLLGMNYLLYLRSSNFPIILVFFGMVLFALTWYYQYKLKLPEVGY